MTMKKWGWLLLGLVVILFFFTREGFQDTQKIKGPPYNEEDYIKIASLMDPSWVMSEYNGDTSTPHAREKIAQNVAPILSQFHADVYQPATQTLKDTDVDKFLTANTSLYNAKHKEFVKSLLVAYFINQPHGDANAPQTQAQTVSANYTQLS
jgi:ABC-type branched-subunit amino acid transport system substrate-binding protein